MKKILFSAAAVCAAGLAMATSVESPNTFGVLKIDSANAETVVSVPWEAVGASGTPIKVKDFVMTTNMSEGDTLYLYDSSTETYKGWILTVAEEVKSWSGLTEVKTMGDKNVSAGGNDALARGQALIICRSNTSAPIYLYGQYTTTGVSYSMAAGKATLFAPVNTTSSAFYLNSDAGDIPNGTTVPCATGWTNVNADDMIRLQTANGNAIMLNWNSTANKWGRKKGDGSFVYTRAVLQPGMGAWYISNGNSAVTLTTGTATGTKTE